MADSIGAETIGMNVDVKQNVSVEFDKAAASTRAETQAVQQLEPYLRNMATDWSDLSEIVGKVQTGQMAMAEGLQKLGLGEKEVAEAATAKNRVIKDQAVVLEQDAVAANTDAEAHTKAAQSHSNFGAEARTARLAIAALTAEMALASVAAGQQLPDGLREAAAGLKTVVDLALAGGIALQSVQGAIIGGLIGAVIALATAENGLSQETADLNAALDRLSKKDDVVKALQDVLGVSERSAEILLKAAQADHDFAASLEAIVKSGEPVPPLIAAMNKAAEELDGTLSGLSETIGGLGEGLNKFGAFLISGGVSGIKFAQALAEGKNIQDAYNEAAAAGIAVMRAEDEATKDHAVNQETVNALVDQGVSILDEHSAAADRAAQAEHTLANALEDAAQRLAQLDARVGQQRLQATQQLNDARANAERTYAEAVERSEQQLADRLTDIAQSTADKIADAQQTLTDKQIDIAQGLADKQADIAQQLADRISSIQQSLSDKEADLAFKHTQDVAKANDDIAKAREDLADKLLEIDRKEIEDLRALDAQTHDDLTKAKTENEADDIQKRAFQQRLAIQRNAEEQRNSARGTLQDAIEEAQKRRELTEQTYQHDLAIARREAAEQIAQARSTAAEQLATAQRTANEQTAAAERAFSEQVAAAQRAQAEQTAVAQRANAEQVANARQAEADKLADAQRTFTERSQAIAASYKLELDAIQFAKDRAQEDYNFRVGLINDEIPRVEALARAWVGVGDAFRYALSGESGGSVGTVGGVGAGGGVGGVPGLGAGGGVGASGGSSSTHTLNEGSIVINIHDATDPRRVGEVVRDVIRRERRRS